MLKVLVLYIHGKGGSASEAEHYKPLFPHCDVVGLDYSAETPWDAKVEFGAAFQTLSAGYSSVILIANSIGAYLSMCTLSQEKIEKAYFISPIVNMEKLIGNMMLWENVSEDELQEKGKIETAFDETLSWEYLCYVRSHPIQWSIPTEILYGGQDDLTDMETITAFANNYGANLTVMENGEHWFHTPEQMAFLDNWLMNCKSAKMISIEYGSPNDVNSWMHLVRKVSSSFPGLETEEVLTEHRQTVLNFMSRQEAICAKEDDEIVGVLLFSKEHNMLCFLAVDLAYRRQHIAEKMFKFMLPHMNVDKPITVTTYRDGVPEGVAARAFYQKLGFVSSRLTVELGSEVQEFVRPASLAFGIKTKAPMRKDEAQMR